MEYSDPCNQYKFYEKIWNVSSAFKAQFRDLCRRRAGGSNYEQLGPFVAAMYRITSDEMAAAVMECNEVRYVGGHQVPLRQLKPSTMPLISFPWLFQDVLGKIARAQTRKSGKDNLHRTLELEQTIRGLPTPSSAPPKRDRVTVGDTHDELETAEGITHRGELLRLRFDHAHDQQSPQKPAVSHQTPATQAAGYEGYRGQQSPGSVEALEVKHELHGRGPSRGTQRVKNAKEKQQLDKKGENTERDDEPSDNNGEADTSEIINLNPRSTTRDRLAGFANEPA